MMAKTKEMRIDKGNRGESVVMAETKYIDREIASQKRATYVE